MSEEAQGKPLTRREQRRIVDELMGEFAAYLRPGERIAVQGERGEDFSWFELTLRAADRSFTLELEAAMIRQDQKGTAYHLDAEERFEAARDFVAGQLYDYFCSDREQRFHLDWRVYGDDMLQLRFRGEERAPKLEEQADELLSAASSADEATGATR
jgi:hypothetical protein